MKKVAVRYAQVHLSELLKEPPFEITRYGRVIARVVKPNEVVKSIPKKYETVGVKLCKHGCQIGLCKHGCTK